MAMSILSVISNFIKGSRAQRIYDKKYDYIFYEIIDFDHDKNLCILKCTNTSNSFHATISEIIFDEDLLYFLHPIHACFIGIEYARFIKCDSNCERLNISKESRKDPVHRYGDYEVIYKDRKGKVCFLHTNTGDKFTMDPRDIVLSSDLIQEFDSSQAFFIGLEAGLKLNNQIDNQRYEVINNTNVKKPFLTLVK